MLVGLLTGFAYYSAALITIFLLVGGDSND